MVNISSFGKILKAEGLGIKSIAQKVYKDKEGALFLVKLKNGSTGTYEVTKDAGQLTQTLSSNGKKVYYSTTKSNALTQDVFSKKANGYVTIPQTQSLSYVRDNGVITSAANYKRMPVSARNYKDPVTGQIRTRINTVQELHADKYSSHMVLPTDKLVAADGSQLPIFQRPMCTRQDGAVGKVWNI